MGAQPAGARRGRRAWLGVLALATALGAATAARAEHRVALVIGNDRYVHLDADRQLEKAVNDAEAVGDALQRDGFTVLRGMNLSRSQMVDKLYDMSALLQPGDFAVFYFAGHGVGLSNGNYLIPSDIPEVGEGQESRLGNQAIGEADVIATLQEKGARVSVIILDACRDNPFKRPGLRSIGLERGMERLPEVNGVFSLYSAGYGQSALDRLSDNDTNANSVFTRVLLPYLTKPGLNLDDLAFEVREDVARLAATTPDHHEQIPAAYNQIIGGRVYLAAGGSDTLNVNEQTSQTTASKPQAQAEAPAKAPEVSAKLEPQSPSTTSAVPNPRALIIATQDELKRLGCDAGPASGEWDVQSRQALLRFSQVKKIALQVDEPTPSTLDRLRSETAMTCKLETQPASRERKRVSVTHARRAVRQVAQEGEHQTLNRSVHQRRGSSTGGSCFVFNGQSVCE